MELTHKEIAERSGKTSSELRTERANVKYEEKALRRSQVLELKKRGWNNQAIARIMDINESTVRIIIKES